MKNFILLVFLILTWGCQMEPMDELVQNNEPTEFQKSDFLVEPVDKKILSSLGKIWKSG